MSGFTRTTRGGVIRRLRRARLRPEGLVSELPEPTFDADGYPTEETLERIATWLVVPGSISALLDFCRHAWNATYGTWVVDVDGEGRRRHVMTTGGWSGNESVVGAMDRNTMLGLLCWWRSERGGLHEYREREAHQL